MKNPNKLLIDFQRKHCQDIPLDSPVVVIRLLEKIVEKIKENNKNEKSK